MKLSAYQLKQQTQMGSNLETQFGNGSSAFANLSSNVQSTQNNLFGSLFPGAGGNVTQKLGTQAQSKILHDNKENSAIGTIDQSKQIKSILKNSTKNPTPQYNSLINNTASTVNQSSKSDSVFYRGQQTPSESTTVIRQDEAKNILMRVDNLLSQSSLGIQNPSKLYSSSNTALQSSLSSYSQFTMNQYSSISSSNGSSSMMKPSNNNSDLRSYINNLESKVLRKKEKDITEIKKSARLASKKKRNLKRRQDSDSSISSIVEEKESDFDSSSSSSDSDFSDDKYANKYLSKRNKSSKRYQYKNEQSKDFKVASQRSQSQNHQQSKVQAQNEGKKEIYGNRKQTEQERRNEKREKKEQKERNEKKEGNHRRAKDEDKDDYLSVSSYQSNVTHNGLNLNKNTNFATDLVFCIVCEDYIHVEKVDEHSKYCEENQQILSQSRRIVEQLSQKNQSHIHSGNSREAEGLHQVEKLNQKLMKIKIYLEEMKINPNIVNASKIKNYAAFLTQCCMNIIANNSYSGEMIQNLNDIHILNKKVQDLENLSNKAVILSILVLGDKLKDFTKKKLDIIDNKNYIYSNNNFKHPSNEDLETKTQVDAFSDYSSVRNYNTKNIPSTPSLNNQEQKRINQNTLPRQIQNFQNQQQQQFNQQQQQQQQQQRPFRTNSATESLSSYQQVNSQSDLDSVSVSSQPINNRKNTLGQRIATNQIQQKNNYPILQQQQQMQTQPNVQGRKPLSKIFQDEKPKDSQFKIQQVTHIPFEPNQQRQQQYQQQPQIQNQNQQYNTVREHQTNQQKQPSQQVSIEVEKKHFFELAVNLKKKYPDVKAVQQQLVVDLYNQFAQTRQPFSSAEGFLNNLFTTAQQQLI